MQRLLINTLIEWKHSKDRRPLLLDGARQVGKSYLLEHLFGKEQFNNVFKLNFDEDDNAHALFVPTRTASDVLGRISLYIGKDFDPDNDLLFFDEIGYCQQALDSLKYFNEQRPDVFLCASGSNIGLLKSFPVGQNYDLTLYPMTFQEFVMASGNAPLIRAFERAERNDIVHIRLSELYSHYLFVGGMPAVVKTWYTSQSPIIKKSQEVRKVQSGLINGYTCDFGKYDPKRKFLASQLDTVFRNVPKQLSKTTDDTLKRYRFSNVIEGKSQYRDFATLIDYLAKTHLLSKSRIIANDPPNPLALYENEGQFKLFCHDVGILHALLNISYQKVLAMAFSYKGYIAENFAQNELLANGFNDTFGWTSGKSAELEFIVENANGDVIPIEIKSGKHTKAKSLDSYLQRYNPKKAYKLCDLIGGFRPNRIHTRPLYYICHAANSMVEGGDLDDYF